MKHAGDPASAVKRLVVGISLVCALVACSGHDFASDLQRDAPIDTDDARAAPDDTESGGLVVDNTSDAVTPPNNGTVPQVVAPTVDPQSQTPDATAAPPATNNFRAPVLFDRLLFRDPMANNVDAIDILVPRGWQAEAGVQWLPEWARAAFLQTRVSDPATGITIEWLPIQNFMYFPAPDGFEVPLGGNYQGKEYLPPITDPAQFVAQFWMPAMLPHLQSATLVDIQQMQPVADEFRTQFGGPADAFAYRMRYEFLQDGQAWEEDVSFALLFSGNADLVSWFVNFAYTVRAPKGQLDQNAGLISTIVASRTTTPQWEATYRIVLQLFYQGIQQQMADTVAFGKALQAYNAEISALQQQVTAERQASQDRIADLRGQSLEGIQTYNDPVNGGLVQLPVGWNDYWVNDQGEYITSDEPGFDPNSLNLGSWQQLTPQL